MPAPNKKKAKKAAKKRLGSQAQDFFDATDRFLDTGERVIRKFDRLDKLIRGGIEAALGPKLSRDQEDYLKRLERENEVMRFFIRCLLVTYETNAVSFPHTYDDFNFDVIVDHDLVMVRKT